MCLIQFPPSLTHSVACSQLIDLGAGGSDCPGYKEWESEFYPTPNSSPLLLLPAVNSMGWKLGVAMEQGWWINPLSPYLKHLVVASSPLPCMPQWWHLVH